MSLEPLKKLINWTKAHRDYLDRLKNVTNDYKKAFRQIEEDVQEAENLIEDLREFPMQGGPSITWQTARMIYEQYAFVYGTEQSLERIAERGGFGWDEVPLIYSNARQKRIRGR